MDKNNNSNIGNNNEEFINADDMQINSLINYSAAEDSGEEIEQIDNYINKNASVAIIWTSIFSSRPCRCPLAIRPWMVCTFVARQSR